MNMEKSKSLILFSLLLFTIILLSNFVSAETVCCYDSSTENPCGYVDIEDCPSGSDVATSCEGITQCRMGTCVDENLGICSSGEMRANCDAEWKQEKIAEIQECQIGCCIIGSSNAYSTTEVECARLATDNNVDINFDKSIVDDLSCRESISSDDLSACVRSGVGIECSMETLADCRAISGGWNEGQLCSTPGLSNCKMSSNQRCIGEDVYFEDTCGNLANIWDKSMDPNVGTKGKTMNDYWTNKIDNFDGMDLDGDCDYWKESTTCTEDRGSLSCGTIECENVPFVIDGRIKKIDKKHGEIWCAESPGVPWHILVDPYDGTFMNEAQRDEIVNGYLEYNLPGSEYYALRCVDGEVVPYEECENKRYEVCKEAYVLENTPGGLDAKYEDAFTTARCYPNNWEQCKDIFHSDLCEDNIDCKWIPGFRFDGKSLDEDANIRSKEQGSCVPLYAPGFDFWEPSEDEQAICELANVEKKIWYDTGLLVDRDDLELDLDKAEKYCTENCDAIPTSTASTSWKFAQSDWEIFNCVSAFGIPFIYGNCNHREDVDVSKSLGINLGYTQRGTFISNKYWITSVTTRGKSLGDCGYKPGINGETSGELKEYITSLFQELKGGSLDKVRNKEKGKLPTLFWARDGWTGADKRLTGNYGEGEDYAKIEMDIKNE